MNPSILSQSDSATASGRTVEPPPPQPYPSIIPAMEWWLWLAGGLALVVAELVTPSGFFIIFFGLGALTVGVLARSSVVTQRWRCSGCCSRVAVGRLPAASSAAACRRGSRCPAAQRRFAGRRPGDRAGAAAPGVVGRVEVRGSIVERAQHERRHARCRPARARRGGRRPDAGGRSRITIAVAGRPSPLASQPDKECLMEGGLFSSVLLAFVVLIVLCEDGDRRAAAERVRRRAAGPVCRRARRRLSHPGAVHRRDPLQALAEGNRRSTSRRRSASRATTCRCRSTACCISR